MVKKYIFGIDIGGTTCKAGLFLEKGELLHKWEFPTDISNQGEQILPKVAIEIQHKLAEYEIKQADVVGIGVGVPGPVTEDGVVNGCVNLGWGRKDVSLELGELIGCAVQVGNDANVAALGELLAGTGKGKKSLILITLGTGVGGGIITDGRISKGAHGAAGEIGHMLINPLEEHCCGCGRKGCLEQYVSATGIVRMAKKMIKENTLFPTQLVEEGLNTKIIFEKAMENDEVARLIIEEVGDILGMAIANLGVIVDPEMVVIGGGVSHAGQLLIDVITKHFQKYAFHANANTPICLAKLGNDAGIFGCYGMMIQEM